MLDRIRRTFRHAATPLKNLWSWASRPGNKGRSNRFQALATWARKKRSQARGHLRHVWDLRTKTYRRKHRFFKEKAQKPPNTDGLSTFDGISVASWMVPILTKARASGLWGGKVISGYRTPEYSESLCYGICNAPSCPGRCAGRASGHSQKVYPGGCVDLLDPVGFTRAMAAQGYPLRNALGAADPNHFSTSGR